MRCKKCKNYEPKESEPREGIWTVDGAGHIDIRDANRTYLGCVMAEDSTSGAFDSFLKELKP